MTTQEALEAFDSHALWSHLDDLLDTVQSTEPRVSTDRATTARVRAVTDYVKLYRSLPNLLFPTNAAQIADSIAASVQGAKTQLEGWGQDAAMLPATVSQLDAYCDEILRRVHEGAWPSLFKESRAAAIKTASTAYIEQAESSLVGLLSDIEDANSQLSDLGSTVEELRAEAAARGEQAESALREMTAAIQANDDELAATLKKRMTAVDAAAEGQRADLAAQAEKHLTALQLNAATGEKLVNRVGDQEIAGGYHKFARMEMWAYRGWTGVGVAVVVGALLYLGTLVQQINELPLNVVIVRAALSVTAVGFSAYAFSQSAKRLRHSVEARYRALDLLALPPFTNGMEPPLRDELRSALGRRLFANSVDSSQSETARADDAVSFRMDSDMAKVLIEAVRAAKT